jgi:transcriptional regulator with XRE-family HTH domain
MGRGVRMRPVRLPEKVLQIRNAFRDTQEGMARRLGFPEITREYVSGFERGIREPPLPVLLRIARIAGISVETLIDDDLELPAKLALERPCGVEGRSSKRAKKGSVRTKKR